MGAGLWVMFLIFYRQLDKPNGRHEGLIQTSIGVDWGIFIAFLLGALLAYAGLPHPRRARPRAGGRRRAAPAGREVPAPAAADPPQDADAARTPSPPSSRAARARPTDDVFDGQLSFDEPAEYRPPPRELAR